MIPKRWEPLLDRLHDEWRDRILTALGLKPTGDQADADGTRQYLPPSWRRDLSREADLIEEVARIHGYDKIPEDVFVPLSLSQKTLTERVLDRIRDTLTAAGFFETITLSFVSGELAELIVGWDSVPTRTVGKESQPTERHSRHDASSLRTCSPCDPRRCRFSWLTGRAIRPRNRIRQNTLH